VVEARVEERQRQNFVEYGLPDKISEVARRFGRVYVDFLDGLEHVGEAAAFVRQRCV
jgi:hypothetical protein